MNRWKVAFFVCLGFAAISISTLLYGILDQAVTLTYQQDSCDSISRGSDILGNIIVKRGQRYSQADVLHLLRQEYPDAFIVESGDRISMRDVSFCFENGKLSEVNCSENL